MDNKSNLDVTETELTPEAFELLAITDTKQWVTEFLAVHGLTFSDAYEYENWDNETQYNGMYIKLVSSEGGMEGGGDHVERTFAIFNFKNEKVAYFEIYGCYNSYDGTEWDDEIVIVEPREVVVTKYFQK